MHATRHPPRDPPHVVLASPGLDHARRGFETFARECFEALRGDPGLDLTLVKGSGPRRSAERRVPTLRRDSGSARRAGRALSRPPFVVEHLSFAASLAPVLTSMRPDLVYFSEWHVGQALRRWRSLTRARFRLLFCNGASAPGPYPGLDHVQQLSPGALEWVTARGTSPDRQTVLPLGVRIEAEPRVPSSTDRLALRERLGLPRDRRIVVSVAALNRQKRLDHLIEEVASLPEPRPFLLLVGDEEEETPGLRSLAHRVLGPERHAMRTVSPDRVSDLLLAGDVFVLASLWEGLPRALIEAMAAGLPCVAHDYPTTSFVVGEHGRLADLSRPGALAAALAELGEEDLDPRRARARHALVYERFSWDRLAPRYVELLRSCAGAPSPVPNRAAP